MTYLCEDFIKKYEGIPDLPLLNVKSYTIDDNNRLVLHGTDTDCYDVHTTDVIKYIKDNNISVMHFDTDNSCVDVRVFNGVRYLPLSAFATYIVLEKYVSCGNTMHLIVQCTSKKCVYALHFCMDTLDERSKEIFWCVQKGQALYMSVKPLVVFDKMFDGECKSLQC